MAEMKRARILMWEGLLFLLENIARNLSTDISCGNFLDFEERISLEHMKILIDTAIHAARKTEHELYDPARTGERNHEKN